MKHTITMDIEAVPGAVAFKNSKSGKQTVINADFDRLETRIMAFMSKLKVDADTIDISKIRPSGSRISPTGRTMLDPDLFVGLQLPGKSTLHLNVLKARPVEGDPKFVPYAYRVGLQ